jgi:hypothetical protein
VAVGRQGGEARSGRHARARCGPSGGRGALGGQDGRLAAGASARVRLPVLALRRAARSASSSAPVMVASVYASWRARCPTRILCAVRKSPRPTLAEGRVDHGVRARDQTILTRTSSRRRRRSPPVRCAEQNSGSRRLQLLCAWSPPSRPTGTYLRCPTRAGRKSA